MLSAIYAVVMRLCVHVCVSVCLSVCVSVTPLDSSFLTPKFTAKFERDHPLRGRQMQVGWVKIRHFPEKRAITRKWYKIDA